MSADTDHWGESPADREWRIEREFRDLGFSGSDDFELQLKELLEDHSEEEALAVLLHHKRPRYFAKEFAKGRWHVCDRKNHSKPLYDDDDCGNDKPLVFDEDAAFECVKRLNSEQVVPQLTDHQSPIGPYWYHQDHPDCQDGNVLWEKPEQNKLALIGPN